MTGSSKNVLWRDIPGYENIYKVSNTGIVISLKRNLKNSGGGVKKKNIVLKNQVNKRGYETVGLYKSGKSKKWFIHRLVMLAFIGPLPEDMDEINHIDFNPLNNRLENLEYTTHRDNARHSYKAGRYNDIPGKTRTREKSKLNIEKVNKLRSLGEKGMSIRALGRMFGISHTQARRILIRENWDGV